MLLNGDVYVLHHYLNYYRIHTCKVTSKMMNSGLQYTELKLIYEYLKSNGCINSINKLSVSGFWIRNIRKSAKYYGYSKALRDELIRLWESDSLSNILCIPIYLSMGFIRFFIKRINRFLNSKTY